MNPVAEKGLNIALHGGIGFGVGCALGAIAGTPVLLTGAVLGATSVARYALSELSQFLAEKFEWKVSTYIISEYVSTALIGVTCAIALLALGIVNPLAFGLIIAGSLLAGAFGIKKAHDFQKLEQVLNDKFNVNITTYKELLHYKAELEKIEKEEKETKPNEQSSSEKKDPINHEEEIKLSEVNENPEEKKENTRQSPGNQSSFFANSFGNKPNVNNQISSGVVEIREDGTEVPLLKYEKTKIPPKRPSPPPKAEVVLDGRVEEVFSDED